MKIEVVPYDPRWPEAFEKEKVAILSKAAQAIVTIHHIGSTAVPGLSAKPIIDMLIETPSLEIFDKHSVAIESLGYEGLGEMGIPGRRYFRKGGENRTHQIHAFATGDPGLRRHLAFRDYLRAHPVVCREYDELKRKVAETCQQDIDQYCEGKNDFMQKHEALALECVSMAKS